MKMLAFILILMGSCFTMEAKEMRENCEILWPGTPPRGWGPDTCNLLLALHLKKLSLLYPGRWCRQDWDINHWRYGFASSSFLFQDRESVEDVLIIILDRHHKCGKEGR